MKVSIIIPAHNEEKRIVPFLEEYVAFFSARDEVDVEMLIVVNNSSDNTEKIVRAYAASHSMVRLFVEPENVGKGGALLLGFDEAVGELVGYVDADGATPPNAFMDLIEQRGDAHVIIASRWTKGADVSPRQPMSRRIASRIFNALVRVMFGFKITDTQCGAKLAEANALHAIRGEIGTTRWAFDVDFLFQFKRKGYTITEYPTIWHDVEGSKVHVIRASAEMFIAMCRLRLLYSPFKCIVTLYDRTLSHYLNLRELELQE